MVVNELMLNAVEHGLKDRTARHDPHPAGRADDTVSLQVEDDGQGLPADFDVDITPAASGCRSSTLVTDDLKGRLAMESIVDASEAEPVIRSCACRGDAAAPQRML